MNTNEPIRDARQLGLPKMLILGLQHMFAMFGATVLVPILVQSYGLPLSIQTTLFFAGIGTLFFHVCTKLKVPAFLGSSFAYLGGFQAMAKLDAGRYAAMEAGEKLQYACGGIVVAGLLYVVLAAVIKAVGVKKVMRFLPPVVTGPMIILIGLSLAPSAVTNASSCWWLAILSITVIVVANIWGRGMIKIIPILLGVVIPLPGGPRRQRHGRHRRQRRRRAGPPHGLLRRDQGPAPGLPALCHRIQRQRGQI